MEEQDNERFYNDFIQRIQNPDPRTLRVNLDELRQQYPHAAQDLIKNPQKYYRLSKNHLERGLFGDNNKPKFIDKVEHYRISFEGNLGANFVTPRGLGSKLAN